MKLLEQTEEYKNNVIIDELLTQMIKNAEEAAKNGETKVIVKELHYGVDFGEPHSLTFFNKNQPHPKGKEDLIGIAKLLWDELVSEGLEPKIESKVESKNSYNLGTDTILIEDYSTHAIIIEFGDQASS